MHCCRVEPFDLPDFDANSQNRYWLSSAGYESAVDRKPALVAMASEASHHRQINPKFLKSQSRFTLEPSYQFHKSSRTREKAYRQPKRLHVITSDFRPSPSSGNGFAFGLESTKPRVRPNLQSPIRLELHLPAKGTPGLCDFPFGISPDISPVEEGSALRQRE